MVGNSRENGLDRDTCVLDSCSYLDVHLGRVTKGLTIGRTLSLVVTERSHCVENSCGRSEDYHSIDVTRPQCKEEISCISAVEVVEEGQKRMYIKGVMQREDNS